jgi:hypothetical protein
VVNTYARRGADRTMAIETRPVPPVPEELSEWARAEPVEETGEHLLE